MPSYGRAEKGHEVVAGRLIAAGANVDTAMVDTGSTPLLVAAQKGHELVVGRLIAAGANKARTNGDTPLSIATRRGHGCVVAQLLASV